MNAPGISWGHVSFRGSQVAPRAFSAGHTDVSGRAQSRHLSHSPLSETLRGERDESEVGGHLSLSRGGGGGGGSG